MHIFPPGEAANMRLMTLALLIMAPLGAQVPNPTQQPNGVANSGQAMPTFRITVVSRTTKAINYNHREGSTKVGFKGTELMPAASGEAEVKSQMGSTKVETHLEKMNPASQYGPEYMTYVLWAITPEGRAMNLGEMVLEGGNHAKLSSTTDLQSFGLIVTAEPYFAVTQPSDAIVAENFIRQDTVGTIQPVEAKFELLKRGMYIVNRSEYKQPKVDPKGPLQLGQAENAVEIARMAGAEQYANDTFQKALVDLRNAEDFLHGKSKDRKRAETNAREATQMAEDARIITYRKRTEEALSNERAAAAQREAAEQAKAQASAEEARKSAEAARLSAEQAQMEQQRRAKAEADQRSADMARQQAEQDRLKSEQARQQAEQERIKAEQATAVATAAKSAADMAREEAMRAQQAAKEEADRLKIGIQKSEAEKAELREKLRTQLNLILETRETARGLIVNVSDVLFDFNKFTLKPGAREKLALVAGILLAYPGLKIQVEGHTDSVGTDEYNMKLSQQRADAVREYLTAQNVPPNFLSAMGMGKGDPVATNATAAGRQRNRRVEMIVSGDAIGVTESSSSGSSRQ
jgi:outer membrane protein OmpA-like peptidoglycan-associated protein